MMVLIEKPKDLNLIAFNGDISTVDLLHLRGHFGIPRFPGDRFVPPGQATRPRPPYVSPEPAQPMANQMPESPPEQYPARHRSTPRRVAVRVPPQLPRRSKPRPRRPPRPATNDLSSLTNA